MHGGLFQELLGQKTNRLSVRSQQSQMILASLLTHKFPAPSERRGHVKAHVNAPGWLFCFGLAIGGARVDTAHAQTKAADADVRVTVIGCIQRSEPLAAETLGTTVIPA